MRIIHMTWGTTSIEVRIRKGDTSILRLRADGHLNSYSRFVENKRDVLSKY